MVLSDECNQHNMTDVLKSIWEHIIPTLEDADDEHRSLMANLWQAQKHLWKVKCKATLLRIQHLKSILNEARAAKQWKKTANLTYIIHAKQNWRCFAEFHNYTKPKSAGGLAYITKTSASKQQPTTIINSDDMNDALLDYSCNHFATAHGTPFTAEPLSCLLQYDGITKFGQLISQGHANLEDLPLDEAMQALLRHLKSKQPHPESLHPLMYEELQNGIKKWPEKTTTSPSRWHLSIYKSLQRHVLTKDKLERLLPEEASCLLKQGRILGLWYHVSCVETHIYTWPIENGLDDVYQKRTREPGPEPPKMHNDFWSWLAASVEMALGLWIPSKKWATVNTHTTSRQWMKRPQRNWSSDSTNCKNRTHPAYTMPSSGSLPQSASLLRLHGWSMP